MAHHVSIYPIACVHVAAGMLGKGKKVGQTSSERMGKRRFETLHAPGKLWVVYKFSPWTSAWEFGLAESWEHFNQMLHDLSVLSHFTQGRTLNCLCKKQQVNGAKLF